MKQLVFTLLSLLVLASPVRAQNAADLSPPEACFETLWQNFHHRYALFEAKGVDWDVLYRVYRPQVTASTTDEELFSVLAGMMGHLNDNHVVLQAPSLGREFSAGLVGTLLADMGLAGAMRYLTRRPLPTSYFQGEALSAAGGVFQYGWVDEGIGYFHFGGFRDAAASAAAVDEILAALEGMHALIIDVRHNRGGDDRVGKAIADRFADTRRLYMTTAKRTGPGPEDFASPRYWHVDPEGVPQTFTGPIILLQNRLSMSAAENFALAMRVLPHATLVGDFSSGCFADKAWTDLPNGWRFSLSWNLFLDYAGRCWEGIGVPPDIMVRGHEPPVDTDEAFEVALALLQAGGPSPQDERASAAAARSSLVDKLVADIHAIGYEAARQAFIEAYKDLNSGPYYLSIGELNNLGYELLRAQQLVEAVAIFELQVEVFPENANAHDSLGEGYMTSGETQRAIASYERSLELNPDNKNAVQMLAQLRAGK